MTEALAALEKDITLDGTSHACSCTDIARALAGSGCAVVGAVTCVRTPEDEGGKLTVHCAGLPESCHPHVTWDNFHVGAKFPGKLYSKTVKGGIILYEGDFVIREETGL